MHPRLRAALFGVTSLAAGPALADQATRAELREMRAEIQLLRRQVNGLTARLAATGKPPTGAEIGALIAGARRSAPREAVLSPAGAARGTGAHALLEHKPGAAASFYVPHGEISAYGNLDVAAEGTTKGIAALRGPGGTGPVGHTGWQADISSNLSYIGVRGFETIPDRRFRFVYQLETQIEISASSGIAETNSNQSNVVKGGLTSRNSYVGIADPVWGTLMIGKTDAPYKQSTARLNPFIAMLGDYAAIMGNTGGDNRVEFGTRLDHAIWYESPAWRGFKLATLFSPGQNRASTSDNIAAGESDCTGGNIPGSGGSLPYACNDGAFSDAISASLTYTKGPLTLVAAYERHAQVNRSSDLTGEYANPPPRYFNADTADEDAAKIGVQYSLPTHTTLSAIFEDLHRYVPKYLDFQNERQRTGYWLAATQRLGEADTLAAGWAHAGRTPGDPGQHDTSLQVPPLGAPGDAVGGADVDNTANLFTLAWLHDLGSGLTGYVNWALLLNGPYAHYALGAGGRAVTVDCHDASDATGDQSSNPHCWAGGHPQGVSAGLRYRF